MATKGIKYERKLARYLAEKGYIVARSAASKGAFDLICIDTKQKEVVLIEVKYGESYDKHKCKWALKKMRDRIGDGVCGEEYKIKTVLMHGRSWGDLEDIDFYE